MTKTNRNIIHFWLTASWNVGHWRRRRFQSSFVSHIWRDESPLDILVSISFVWSKNWNQEVIPHQREGKVTYKRIINSEDAARLFRRPITSTVGWGHWLQIFYSRIIGCHPGVTLGLTSAPIHLWQQSPRSLLVKWQKACGPKMIWEKSSFWLKILAEIASLPFLSFCKFA